MSRPKIIAVVGPTASGKSALAVDIALRFGGEVVSADSMQVYRHMDIGTAKPAVEEMRGIPHHMIDVVDPDEEFSAADFREMASVVIDHIQKRGKVAIVAGGTGLYIRALIRGLADTPKGDPLMREELKMEAEEYGREFLHEKLKRIDPVAAENIHANNVVRVIRAIEVAMLADRKLSEVHERHGFGESPYDVMMLGIDMERALLCKRIEERVDRMIGTGLKGEVERLLEMGYDRNLKPMRGVGYKEMCAHILDAIPIDRAVELIKRDSRRYAKRQMTWFRKEDVRWGTAEDFRSTAGLNEIAGFLKV